MRKTLKKVYYLSKNLRNLFENIVNKVLFWYFGVTVEGKPDYILGILTIRTQKKQTIRIGKNVKFHAGKKYNIVGSDTRLILRTFNSGHITIGNNVGISNAAIISSDSIIIEEDVLIGGGCIIWDTDFHSIKYEDRMEYPDTHVKSSPVTIKRGAFIGGNSIILKGVTIGEQSIIAAGSVVCNDVPDREVWGGNPAKRLKAL